MMHLDKYASVLYYRFINKGEAENMAQKTDSIPKVPKVNVSKTTFDILFRNIMDGTWKTGEKIPSENELKNSLMVSRHTIRSAIANLNMLGILETRQGDGNYVRETGIGLYIDFLIPYLMINTANVSQIIEFREAIEISVARLAARRATEENLEDIRQKLEACNSSRHNTTAYPAVDLEFHCAIARASKNDLLIQSMNVIKQYCFQAISSYFTEDLAEAGADCHQKLFEALCAHNEDEAALYMSRHMANIIPASPKTILPNNAVPAQCHALHGRQRKNTLSIVEGALLCQNSRSRIRKT